MRPINVPIITCWPHFSLVFLAVRPPRMLKNLRSKAPPPALSAAPIGGRRSACNFPFAKGEEALQARSHTRVDNSIVSSCEEKPNLGPWGKLRAAMASSNQSLAFPRTEAEEVGNPKFSLPHSTGDDGGGDDDDDDFTELGPSLSKDADLGFFNLVTEKRKVTVNRQHVSRKMLNLRLLLEECNHHPPCIQFNSDDHNDTSRLKNEAEIQKYTAENNENHSSSLSISIERVAPGLSILNLLEAVSVYGEISCASMKTRQDGLPSCHVRFKSMESKERALAAKWITMGNCRLPVRDLHTPEQITVRISNINMETTEPSIHSMCMLCGPVAGLARTKEGAADVVFKVEDNLAAQSIVKRLNDVVADDCRWSAQLLPKISQNSKINISGQWWVGLQISNLMGSFRKQFQMQRIYLEDLEGLHHAVLHLRDQPADTHS